MTVEQVEPRGTRESTIEPEALRRAAARRPLKRVIGRLLYQSHLYKQLWHERGLIALFHRIDDRYPTNPMTCSTALFRETCDFLARYFRVVPLTELLERLSVGADISRRVAITFDDGYRDNFTFAAPELRKRGLPATFFISTNFIGTDHTAWWDAEQGICSEWMTWDDVRALHEQGFDLGSHTCTHVDCGQSDADRFSEIVGSKSRLEEEIGTAVKHFAFPYGAPNHMTEENRAIVRDAGFACCLAGHGGVVAPSDSAFRLCRVPINNLWHTSPYQFGFETTRMASRSRRGRSIRVERMPLQSARRTP